MSDVSSSFLAIQEFHEFSEVIRRVNRSHKTLNVLGRLREERIGGEKVKAKKAEKIRQDRNLLDQLIAQKKVDQQSDVF